MNSFVAIVVSPDSFLVPGSVSYVSRSFRLTNDISEAYVFGDAIAAFSTAVQYIVKNGLDIGYSANWRAF